MAIGLKVDLDEFKGHRVGNQINHSTRAAITGVHHDFERFNGVNRVKIRQQPGLIGRVMVQRMHLAAPRAFDKVLRFDQSFDRL